MVESGEDAALALEAALVVVAPMRVGDLLERDQLRGVVEAALGQPHPAHAAAAEFAHDAVLRKLQRAAVAVDAFGTIEDVERATRAGEAAAQGGGESGFARGEFAQAFLASRRFQRVELEMQVLEARVPRRISRRGHRRVARAARRWPAPIRG